MVDRLLDPEPAVAVLVAVPEPAVLAKHPNPNS